MKRSVVLPQNEKFILICIPAYFLTKLPLQDVDTMSLIALGGASVAGSGSEAAARTTHSCPSSPTETECSSGFSTLRPGSAPPGPALHKLSL